MFYYFCTNQSDSVGRAREEVLLFCWMPACSLESVTLPKSAGLGPRVSRGAKCLQDGAFPCVADLKRCCERGELTPIKCYQSPPGGGGREERAIPWKRALTPCFTVSHVVHPQTICRYPLFVIQIELQVVTDEWLAMFLGHFLAAKFSF